MTPAPSQAFKDSQMNKERIYARLDRINETLYGLECRIDNITTERDRKELSKKKTKLIKERNKLEKRLCLNNEQ